MLKETDPTKPQSRDPDKERQEDQIRLDEIKKSAIIYLGDNYDGSGIEYINAQNEGMLAVEEENRRNESY